MNRDDVIRMARDVCNQLPKDDWNSTRSAWVFSDKGLQIFSAALLAAAERKRLANEVHSCHANCDRPACVATRRAVAEEREACAKVCEKYAHTKYAADAIRARGQA